MSAAISITSVIKRYLRDEGISQAHLAALLNESPQNLSNKLRKHTLDSDYIMRICIALKYDFFRYLSGVLERDHKIVEPASVFPDGGLTYSTEVTVLTELRELRADMKVVKELVEKERGATAADEAQ